MLRRRTSAQRTHALAPAEDAPLDKLYADRRRSHPDDSGVRLVALGTEAFALSALSARAAARCLDLQYYIWHSDATGLYLANEVLLAADRGVRVRLLLDDMDARSRDGLLMALDQHPQIEIRLFNPFATRSGMLRTLGELFSRGSRLNHRMHNKSWIADGRLALVGGRNVGDEYFSASAAVNFVDLDVLLAGSAVSQAERIFDEYWNSVSAVPIARLRRTARNRRTLDQVRALLATALQSQDNDDYVMRLHKTLRIGELLEGESALAWSDEVEVVADDPRKAIKRAADIRPGVQQSLDAAFASAQRELLLISPYFVPGPEGADHLCRKAQAGNRVAVLTNSLAATDVAAVHSGYSKYRGQLLDGGVELFELKPAPEARGKDNDGDTPHLRIGSSRASLHTKAAIVDQERIFVGSFNLDPRSAVLNCEMGVWIASPALARQLAQMFELGANPQSSFVVTLDAHRNVVWTEQLGGKSVQYHREPGTTWWRRAVIALLRLLPIESQL